ncbi:MAG: nitrate- and nitrite sensing domain-containing protein [Spongiibacteraceae bacterium]
MHIRSAKIGINTLITIPAFVILCFSVIQINTLLDKANHFKKLQQLNLLIQDLSSLVYELQLERCSSVVYLASAGYSSNSKMQQQRNLSDLKQQAALTTLQTYDQNSYNHQAISRFLQTLNDIDNIRQKIDLQTMSADDTLAFYTQLNHQLLDFIASQTEEFPDADLARNFIAYTHFLYAIEQAGIERALLGDIFIRKQLDFKHYRQFLEAISTQASHHRDFKKLADNDLVSRFEQLQTDNHYVTVEKYRDLLHTSITNEQYEINQVDTLQWFKAASQKINHQKSLEVLISTYQQDKISEMVIVSRSMLYLWVFIGLLTLSNWMIIAMILARKIKRSFTAELSQYQKLFNQCESATVVIDLDSQCYLFSNAAFARLLDYPQAEISGMPCINAHPEEMSSQLQTLLTNTPIKDSQIIENFQFKRRDGSLFWADMTPSPIMIGGQRYIAANIKDNTQRRATEQTLQTVLDSMNQAVAVTRLHSHDLIYMNEQARKFQRAEGNFDAVCSVMLNWLIDVGADNQQEQYHARIDRVIFNKHNNHWYQFRARHIQWYDGSSVALHMLEDITEQHQITEKNQRLLRENRALTKRNFDIQEQTYRDIAMELHDQLGQLIAVIIMKSDQLISQLVQPDDELYRHLIQIGDTARHIANTVNQVIDRLRPVLLDQLGLQDAIGELVQNWQQFNPAIHYQFKTLKLLPPLSDEAAITLYRVAQESLTNASKHSQAKNIEVSLSYHPSEDTKVPDGMVILTVSDDGIGLGDQYSKATGMGLINMRERMWSVGGSFNIESPTGSGIIIRATLQNKLNVQKRGKE